MKRFSFLLFVFLIASNLSAQISDDQDQAPADTLSILPEFTTLAARKYIDQVVNNPSAWRTMDDPVKNALERLLDHSIEPFDTVRSRLLMQDFRAIDIHTGNPVETGRMALKWLNDSTFLIDPKGWSPNLYLREESKFVYPVDLSSLVLSDSLLDENGMLDPTLFTPDTVIVTVIDTSALNSLGIALHYYKDKLISPPLALGKGGSTPSLAADRRTVIYYRPGTVWEADEDSPFLMMDGRYQLDSLQYAVNKLLEFTEERDSTMLWLSDMSGRKRPFWISSGSEEEYRFWVKNYNNDSVTVWLGNPGSQELRLTLEDDVNFNRLVKEDFEHLPSFVQDPESSLRSMKMLEPIPKYWDFGFLSAFILNQTYLSNWTKGGESSLSAMMDIQLDATYNNKDANTQWINAVRMKFGTIMTQEKGFRKNHDALEINSKFNRNAWGKIGMSASLYMKHQLAKGYNYPNDSIPISKFLNPGTMTLGLGFEYKPAKEITFNVAPLSYKTTFVLDTANINQTLHGIDKNARAKREMGTQIVVSSKVTPFESMEITNNLRLFSNYLKKPQNIDVDWELIVDQKINWFFNIRLNLHLIYDDDVRFPVLDENNQPVLLPDGTEKKVADMQFKEFIGLSLQFKF
ncbi:MAG: DUF3078 domain-containing protein [Bacteroidia bacterium]|nr:MAG: DUF3078 domain-containing protein [Bacteroidia bacterium]